MAASFALFLIIVLAVGVIAPDGVLIDEALTSGGGGSGGGGSSTPTAGGSSGGGGPVIPNNRTTCSTNDDCPSVRGEPFCDNGNVCGSVSVYSCVNGECVSGGGGVGCRTCENGCANGECIIDGEVEEQVKCIFADSIQEQKCYTAESNSRAYCSGVESCITSISGYKGEKITWKSSCGGYAYTTIDGEEEYAKFDCSEITEPVCGNGVCEVGEGLICTVPAIACAEGETCSTRRERCEWGCAKDCQNVRDIEANYDEKFRLKISQNAVFKDPRFEVKFNTIMAPRRCEPPTSTYTRTCTYAWNSENYVNQEVEISTKATDVKGNTASDDRGVEVVEELNGSSGGGGSGSTTKLYVSITKPSSSIIEAREDDEIIVYAKGPNRIEDLTTRINGVALDPESAICIDSAAGGGGGSGGDIPAVTTETKARVTAQYIVGKVIGEDEAPSAGGGGPICISGLPIAVLQVTNYEGRRQRTEVVKIKLNEMKRVFDKVISFLDYDRKTKQGVFLVSLLAEEDVDWECLEDCICDEDGNIIECVIEVEECVGGTSLCPDGVCREECEVTDQTAECDFGCFYEEKCLPYGLRVNKLFCDISNDMKTQFSVEETCDNNFECSSNLCIDGECVKLGLFKRFSRWFSRVFD